MIVPDINLLVYAYNRDSSFHAAAAAWWKALLSGADEVGLASVVVAGFLRLVTQPRVFERPLRMREAGALVRSWLARPMVEYLTGDTQTLMQALALLESAGGGGNLVTDAYLAALAMEYRALVHTADADFARFPGVRWRNPLTCRGNLEMP